MKCFVIDLVVQGSSDFTTEHYPHRESDIHFDSLYFEGEKARPWVVATSIWTAIHEQDMVEAWYDFFEKSTEDNMCRV